MKREVVEGLWAAGCDVVSMIPVRSTLEELFLKTVDREGGGSMNGKVRAIAWNTFHALLRNKVIILFLAGFVCVLLLMMTPLLLARGARAGQSQEQMQAIVLPLIGAIMAWSAASAACWPLGPPPMR